jgi:hypothetical protein
MTSLPESPVLPSMASYMKVDFMFNDKGVWILHDQPLPEILRWVDYDTDSGTVTLNTAQGKTQELGLPIPARASERLRKSVEISVMLIKDGKIADFTIVPLNILTSAKN